MRRNMRAERARRGWAASELGQRIGRSAHMVLLYERGDYDVPGSILMKLSELYDCEPEYLLQNSNN